MVKMTEASLSGGVPSASQPHLLSALSFLWKTLSRQRPRTFPTQETSAQTSLLPAPRAAERAWKASRAVLTWWEGFFSSVYTIYWLLKLLWVRFKAVCLKCHIILCLSIGLNSTRVVSGRKGVVPRQLHYLQLLLNVLWFSNNQKLPENPQSILGIFFCAQVSFSVRRR